MNFRVRVFIMTLDGISLKAIASRAVRRLVALHDECERLFPFSASPSLGVDPGFAWSSDFEATGMLTATVFAGLAFTHLEGWFPTVS